MEPVTQPSTLSDYSPIPERFRPEPLLYGLDESFLPRPPDLSTPPPIPSSRNPIEIDVYVAPYYRAPVTVWVAPYNTAWWLSPTPMEFRWQSGRDFPGIQYGRDALWLESWGRYVGERNY